jgi:hypothetical protein
LTPIKPERKLELKFEIIHRTELSLNLLVMLFGAFKNVPCSEAYGICGIRGLTNVPRSALQG